MVALLSKELRFLLGSLSGVIFILIYLLLSGGLLWIIPGEYNIPESGYASLSAFFFISPVLFMLFIPALSMRTFSEEKSKDTLLLLFTRPVSLSGIIFSKILAVYIVVLISLIPTFLYVISVYRLGNPVGSVDLPAVAGSYLGLLFTVAGFVSMAVFASSITSNQVVAFITGLLLCSGFYFGFDLLSGLFSSGSVQLLLKQFGFLYHYQSVQRGLIDGRDVFYMLFVSCLFFMLTALSLRKKPDRTFLIAGFFVLVCMLVCSFVISFRIDFTKDKRYTINSVTKTLLHGIKEPLKVDLYLDGELNAGFTRLKRETLNLLADFSSLSQGQLTINVINPYLSNDKDLISKLDKQGIRGIAVNERDASGRQSQQVIFPWAVVTTSGKSIPVPLLVNDKIHSGQENLNTSIELLEYQFASAIHSLMRTKEQKIAFLYGHNELNENYLKDTWDQLSHNYQVDAGILSPEVGQLDAYSLVILAGSRAPFNEGEKYILDQYLMQGGKLIFFINGAIVSPGLLEKEGQTPSMANNVNLDDMLFNYGVRINSVLVEDVQCIEIPVNTAVNTDNAAFIGLPWYFAPLLSPASHPVTKGLAPVKSQFVSTLSFVGNHDGLKKETLLSTSEYTHVVQVPEMVSLHETDRKPDNKYFDRQHLPVAALVEGAFNSLFANRIPSKELNMDNRPFLASGKPTRLAVIASEDIIQNDIYKSGDTIRSYPAGYDRYSGIQYGNQKFIRNLVDYMVDDSGLRELQSKTHQMYLLDKQKFYDSRTPYILLNILLPSAMVILLYLTLSYFRKRKYAH